MVPCSVMSIFYYVLFGLMLSDAAYGLLVVIGCGVALLKFKNMESGMRKTLQMFFFCGISTTFWGFMFGSFFGDLVGVVATTFFGRPDIALGPIWFEPVKEPMRSFSSKNSYIGWLIKSSSSMLTPALASASATVPSVIMTR